MKTGLIIIVVGKFALTTLLFFIPFLSIFSQTTKFKTSSQVELYKRTLLQPESNFEILHEALNYFLMFGISSDDLKNVTRKVLRAGNYPRELQIKILEIANAFYRTEFIEEIERIYFSTKDSYIQSLAYFYLLNNGYELNLQNSHLKNILEYVVNLREIKDPPLKDIFKWKIPQAWIFYSIHPRSREYAGILVIKTPEGRFLRNVYGNIFHIPQFARAITNLPYFFVNGHTPSGVYKLGKRTTANNPSIGTIPILPLYLPFEISKKLFMNRVGAWEEKDIRNLFPKSWWDHQEIYESFYAGKLGRSKIAIHGSKVDSKNFEGLDFYPFQPAFGCITTLEIWKTDDILEHSYQVELLQTLENENVEGFVYVINRNLERRILLEDVLLDILEVEASLP